KAKGIFQAIIAEVAARQIENRKGRLKIRARKQVADQRVGFRVLHVQQQRGALKLLGDQRLFEERVAGEARFEIVVLRRTARGVIGAHANRGRRAIQVEQRMDVLLAWENLFDLAQFQQLDAFQVHVADQEMLVDLLPALEAVVAVNAGTEQHLK